MNAHVNMIAIAVIAVCAGTIWSRASSAPLMPVALPATDEQRAAMAKFVALQEPGWRKSTEQDFPGDLWSQRDAFHGHEATTVRDQAFTNRVTYEDVLRAIDEELHKAPTRDRNANAIPCKPRPFYD